MGVLIDSLHGLYDLERQLRTLRQGIAARKRQAAIQARRVATLESELEAKREELTHRKAESAQHDLEVAAFDEQVARLRVALNQAKTNKEYSAILTQINTTKADSSRLETRALTLIEDIERLGAELSDLEKQIETERGRSAELEAAVAAYQREVADELRDLESRRDASASEIPPSVRSTFERVADNYEGEALAHVVQVHPKRLEFSCGGCHMAVTLEQVNSLKSRDDIQCCNVCGRILFLEAPSRPTVS